MNYTTLISAEALVELKAASTDVCIVDCRFNLGDTSAGLLAWQKDHIPDAFYAHLDDHLSSPIVPGITGRHPLPNIDNFVSFLQSIGVSSSTQVIAYDDCNGAMAARLWWLCRWIGHLTCAVLDGGIQAWREVGPTTSEPPDGSHAGDIAAKSPLLTSVSTALVAESKDFLLVDARDYARYIGEVEPIDPVAGHIPGAICIPFSENSGADGKFLNPGQLKQRFDCLTTTSKDKIPVMYCGSGVTAAHNVLAMAHAGFDAPALYADSWSGWITNPDNPIATGQ